MAGVAGDVGVLEAGEEELDVDVVLLVEGNKVERGMAATGVCQLSM